MTSKDILRDIDSRTLSFDVKAQGENLAALVLSSSRKSKCINRTFHQGSPGFALSHVFYENIP
jgi:hypothetical protein